MFWSRVPNVEMYRIYRSRTPDFKIGADTFMTFVAGNTQSFADNGFDFDGTSLKRNLLLLRDFRILLGS